MRGRWLVFVQRRWKSAALHVGAAAPDDERRLSSRIPGEVAPFFVLHRLLVRGGDTRVRRRRPFRC